MAVAAALLDEPRYSGADGLSLLRLELTDLLGSLSWRSIDTAGAQAVTTVGCSDLSSDLPCLAPT